MWSLNDFNNMLLNIVLRCSTSNSSRVEYVFTNCCGNKFLYEVWNDTYSGTCTLCSDHELHTQIIQQIYSIHVAGYEFYQTFRSISMKVQNNDPKRFLCLFVFCMKFNMEFTCQAVKLSYIVLYKGYVWDKMQLLLTMYMYLCRKENDC